MGKENLRPVHLNNPLAEQFIGSDRLPSRGVISYHFRMDLIEIPRNLSLWQGVLIDVDVGFYRIDKRRHVMYASKVILPVNAVFIEGET